MSYPCPPNEGNTRNSDLRSASIAIRRSADPSAPELPRNEENEDEDSTERKAKARREANRLASMNSRQRRKALIKQLEVRYNHDHGKGRRFNEMLLGFRLGLEICCHSPYTATDTNTPRREHYPSYRKRIKINKLRLQRYRLLCNRLEHLNGS